MYRFYHRSNEFQFYNLWFDPTGTQDMRTRDEHAHNYMTDTKHSLPSIVDTIKPKVHRIANIFLRLYDFIQNQLIAMT